MHRWFIRDLQKYFKSGDGGRIAVKAMERAEGVRQVILFANGVLVFECSCPAMSIRLLIKIKETAYLVERRT